MTKDQTQSLKEVIAWARECRLPSDELYYPNLERFAALAYAAGAAAEREACADACDQQANAWQQAAWSHSAIEAHAIRQCAAAIRSRKENT